MKATDKAMVAEGEVVVMADDDASGTQIIQCSGIPRIQMTLPLKQYGTYGQLI